MRSDPVQLAGAPGGDRHLPAGAWRRPARRGATARFPPAEAST